MTPGQSPPAGPALRLSLNLGPWAGDPAADRLALVLEAERLGYSTVWVPEAYGCDAATPLGWLAAQTRTIGLGAGVFQVPARSPAMTAMTAVTLDILSGGRFTLGLGVSGRQVSEGWHGVDFDHPIDRLREYVTAVRVAMRREPLSVQGDYVRVPPPGSAARSIALAVRPVRAEVPIHLAAVGPRALDLCGSVADGWLSSFADTVTVASAVTRMAAQRAADRPPVEVTVTCPAVVTAEGVDPAVAAAPVRPHVALYIGGMGGRSDNVYAGIARRLGYGEATDTVQDHYLSKRRDAAAAAVPAEFIEQVSLIGTPTRIAARMREYAAAGATTLAVTPFGATREDRLATLGGLAEALALAAVAA